MSLLKLDNISYHYDKSRVMVLNNLNMEFDAGKIYTIVGKSGAGKTTLLSVLSSLAAPTDGRIFLDGEDITRSDKYKFRSRHVGVIFQNFNLLTHLTALENVVLSMDISGKKFNRPKKEIALELLKKVGLSEDETTRRVLKLSGGQQQRVAIARALSYDPSIILADEPTGNLDGETQDEIIGIFRMLADEGKCVIIVTHSPEVAAASDKTYRLEKTK